jgi:glycosyltransferase involved in cell wall biosynthesis
MSRSIRPVPILLMVRELNTGGIERDVTKLAQHIDRSRFTPHVGSFQATGMRYEELKSAGIPMLHLDVPSLKSPVTILSGLRMMRYLLKHKIRLVHGWDTSVVFSIPWARAVGVRAVLSSMLGSRDLLDDKTRRNYRWSDRKVDAIVVNCEAMRRHMMEDEAVAGDRIELCYNGVDTSQFYPVAGAPKPDPLSSAPFVIGAVCVLRQEKALDLLQDAFSRVRHLKPGMKLAIVGSGPELPRLQAAAARLGIQDSCVFVPATPHVPQYLNALDIFVLSSHSEAFSNSLLEAMACGCAAIGSRVGGTPELLGDNQRGLLFEPGNPADLADKLALLIQNDSLRKDLGSSAAAFASKNLSMEIAAQRISEIYDSVLRRKQA